MSSLPPDHIPERLAEAHNAAAHAAINASLLQQEVCLHKRLDPEAALQLAQHYLTLRENLEDLLMKGTALRAEYNRAFEPIFGMGNVSPLACQCAAYERAAAVRDAVAEALGLMTGHLVHTDFPTLRHDLPENEATAAWQREMEEWKEREALTYQLEWLAGKLRECWCEVRKRVSQLPVLDAISVSHDLGRGLDDARKELRLLRAANANLGTATVPGTSPWEGKDWNALPPKVRGMLRFMHGRDRAELEEVFPVVWEREYEAGKGDVSAALNKANNFLAKRQSRRTLHKRRGEGEIYWE